MLHRAKEMMALQIDKSELRTVQRLFRYALRAGNKYHELWLSHHAMEFHGRTMGDKVRGRANQVACHQIGISKVLYRASQLWRDDDKKTSLQPGHQSALCRLMEEAAGQGRRQPGYSRGIGGRENGLPGIVESHQKPSHWPPRGSQILVICCAHWIACRANYCAYNINILIFCVKQIALQDIFST